MMIMVLMMVFVVSSGKSFWSTQVFPIRINFSSQLEELIGYVGQTTKELTSWQQRSRRKVEEIGKIEMQVNSWTTLLTRMDGEGKK